MMCYLLIIRLSMILDVSHYNKNIVNISV